MSIAQAQRTHCPRGHRLTGHNLVPATRAVGRRACLVCMRARTALVNLELRGRTFPDRQAALLHYAAIELSRTDKGRDLVAADALRTDEETTA